MSLVGISPVVINVLFGEKFLVVAGQLQIILPTIYFGMPGMITSSSFKAEGPSKTLVLISSTTAVASFVAMAVAFSSNPEIAPLFVLAALSLGVTFSSMCLVAKRVHIKIVLPTVANSLVLTAMLRQTYKFKTK